MQIKSTAAHAMLPNLKMHASLLCAVLNKYYEDSVQAFGALREFL
jgi:hypothetical protein